MPWGPPTLAAAMDVWKSFVRLGDGFSQQYPEQFTRVYYEKLVSEPDQTLTGIMAFLGERFEPRQLQVHTPSGVVLPRSFAWKGQALRPIDPGRIGNRRGDATTAEHALFEAVLSEELRRHGYA
jgi:hypothetical protein